MPRLQAKSFAAPDSVREMPRARIASLTLDDSTIGYCAFDPGWRWSTDLGPLLGTASCPIRHVGYVVSGAIHVVMDDGQTLDVGPNSVFEIPPGHDKWVVGDEPWVTIDWGASGRAVVAAMRETGTRTLATVMFTDIVDSTRRAQEMGDEAWRDLLAHHNEEMRVALSVHHGREIKTTGDGFLALFDSPTRAALCAAEMLRSATAIGLAIRVGIHTGEVEVTEDDVRGIAVHTAARILALAGPGTALFSTSAAELVDGPGLSFEDAGSHELKGLAGVRRVSRLVVAGGRDRGPDPERPGSAGRPPAVDPTPAGA
jgi:class 3 adenylate cyclase